MTLQEAREFFANDKYATEASGITIEEVGQNYSKCRMPIGPIHKNAVGGVMGGAVYTLCDFAFAVATNTPESHTVTAVSQISYMSLVKGDELFATAELIKDGRRTCFFKVTVTDNLGTLVAIANTTGMHV